MPKGKKCLSSGSFPKTAATAQSPSPSKGSFGGNRKSRDRKQQPKKTNEPAIVNSPVASSSADAATVAVSKSVSVPSIELPQSTASDIDIAYPFRDTKISVATFIQEWNKKVMQRQKFYDSNKNVVYEEFEKLITGKQLDSTFKKCTAFVRKIKLFLETQKPVSSLESELNTLNLSKYISEITTIILEIKLKYGDIPNTLIACSELHKRYKDFSKHLMEKLISMKPTKALIMDVSTLAKVSTDLRLLAELVLAGILQESGCHLLVKRIEELVSLDSKATLLIGTFTGLLRGLYDDLVGTLPKDVAVALKEKESQLHHSQIICARLKKDIRGILRKYFNVVKTNIIQKNQAIMGSEKYNRKLRDTKGEIPEDRQQAHMEMVVSFEKYHSSAVKLAYLLDCSMPKLRQLPPDPEDEFEKALLMSEDGVMLDEVPGIVLFEDEETRQFYQDLPDLEKHRTQIKSLSNSKTISPRVQDEELPVSDDSETESEQSEDDDEDFDMEKESAELASENMPVSFEAGPNKDVLPSKLEVNETSKKVDEDEQSTTARLYFREYLDNLQNCVNKAMIDKAAYDFVENFNTKSYKEKLVRHLFSVSRNRMDLVRLYSRLVATLSQVYSKIGSDICEMLRKDFIFLVLKRDQTKIDSKLKIVRFIAELTNFSIFPKSKAFNCLKLLFRSFVNHQIWMACAFLDTCGKFLYKHYDSHRRMKLYLAEMLRRKSAKFLESRYITMIESSYYQICPPPGGTIRRKQKSPLQAFMEFYLCQELVNLESIKKARTVLKKHNWNDEGQFNLVVKILSSPWNYNYSQLDTLAALIQTLQLLRPRATQAIVEEVSEGIRMGCECECEEINNFRMSTCQYFAFLYNYKLVPTTALLNVLYYLISYGVTYQPNQFSIMDPPDSLYRIRLICEMLRISEEYLSSKYSQRLDFFLQYFQRYFVYKKNLPVWTTCNKFPVYVQEAFEDTVKGVRKNWVFAKSMEEVEKDIEKLESTLKENVSNKELKRAIHNETKCVRIPVVVSKKETLKPNFAQITSGSVDGLKKNWTNYKKHITNSKVNGKLHQSMKYGNNSCGTVMEEEDDFEEAFESMCSESIGGAAAWPKSDIPCAKAASNAGTDQLNYGQSTVKVTLLTKGNNKPKAKTLVISQQEDFVVNIKKRENAEKMEKEEVKHRTLELASMQAKEEQKQNERELQEIIQRICVMQRHK